MLVGTPFRRKVVQIRFGTYWNRADRSERRGPTDRQRRKALATHRCLINQLGSCLLGLLTALIIGVFTQPTADEIKTCALFSGASGAADYKPILISSGFSRPARTESTVCLPQSNQVCAIQKMFLE